MPLDTDPKVTDQFTASIRREREADRARIQSRYEALQSREADLKGLLAATQRELAEHEQLLHRPAR